MNKSSYGYAALAGVAAMVLAWMSHAWLLDMVSAGAQLIVTSPREWLANRVLTASSFFPVGVALAMGFFIFDSRRPGLLILLVALASTAGGVAFMHDRMAHLSQTVRLSGMPAPLRLLLPELPIHHIGLFASLCACVCLLGCLLWRYLTRQGAGQ